TLRAATVSFDGAERAGAWSFNFNSPALLRQGHWHHVAAVMRPGKGVRLYVNGQAVAEKKNEASRAVNNGPLSGSPSSRAVSQGVSPESGWC
ncbi:MAG: LamG-like jellyroll fold domain-containing protein, partial [Pirellulales bacterium]